MSDCRLKFTKTGRAKFISHLDLSHTIQRAFFRAGLKMRHSQGFNPHPIMSIAIPLSVGHESICELMDYSPADNVPFEEIPDRLNPAMPEGIEVISAYVPERKFRDIAYMKVCGRLTYAPETDCEVAAGELCGLFSGGGPVSVEKKSKKGMTETDILPLIREISFLPEERGIIMDCIIRAQEPGLNPAYIVKAVEKYLPHMVPEFASFKRIALYDENLAEFK